MLIKFGLEFTISKAMESENQGLLSKLEEIGYIISSSTLDNISYIPDILSIFINNIGIPLGLGEHGIMAENIPNLAKLASEDSCHATHPYPVTMEDFTAVYTRAL